MNFMLHRRYALRELGSPLAGIGAMLPDLWRLADRRMRARRDVGEVGGALARELQRGVDHHLEVDRWFHKTTVFVRDERDTAERFRAVEAPKLVLFAHIGWEMCLDGALLMQQGLDSTLGSLRNDFEAAEAGLAPLADAHGARDKLDGARSAFDQRMLKMRRGLEDGRWLEGYCHGQGLAEHLAGMRARMGFEPLTAKQQRALSLAFEERLRHAPAALEELWIDRRERRGPA